MVRSNQGSLLYPVDEQLAKEDLYKGRYYTFFMILTLYFLVLYTVSLPPLAGIGKLLALAGRYFRFGITVHVFFAYLMVFTRFHITLTLSTVISTPSS